MGWILIIAGVITFIVLLKTLSDPARKNTSPYQPPISEAEVFRSIANSNPSANDARKFLKPNRDIEDNGHPFWHKTIVFTGVLESIDRDKAWEICYWLGADVNTSISKRTNFVVLGTEPGYNKMEKILLINRMDPLIKVLTEDEFMEAVKDLPYLKIKV